MQSPILEPRRPDSASSCFMLFTHPEMLVLRSPWPLMGCIELLATQKQLWADPNSFGQPMHYGEPRQGPWSLIGTPVTSPHEGVHPERGVQLSLRYVSAGCQRHLQISVWRKHAGLSSTG